jgi:hypothetical protein
VWSYKSTPSTCIHGVLFNYTQGQLYVLFSVVVSVREGVGWGVGVVVVVVQGTVPLPYGERYVLSQPWDRNLDINIYQPPRY